MAAAGMDVTAALAALDRIISGADAAATRFVTRSEVVFEAEVKKVLSAQSHPRGTPTNASKDGPPSKVSGTLARSVLSDPASMTGPGIWQGRTYPTTVYARIQELGGKTGRGGKTTIPARPYVRPTEDSLQGKFDQIQTEEYGALLSF